MNEYEKIVFGNYMGNSIVWRILHKDADSIFLLSESALDNYYFNAKYEHVEWENCTLRQWLNNDFYSHAFSDHEKNMIIPVEHGENGYKDYVFCLNISECQKYLPLAEDRVCYLSEYVMKKNDSVWSTENGRCIWWLRSVAHNHYNAIYVEYSGELDPYSSECVGTDVDDSRMLVRPAIKIRRIGDK